jgi:hypothetical protein
MKRLVYFAVLACGFAFCMALPPVGYLLGQTSAIPGLMGSPTRIGRQCELQTVALNTAEGTTAVIEWGGANNGTIYIPTGSPITSLTYYAGYDTGVAFLPLFTNVATPVAVTQTVSAAKSYDLPDAVRGARYLKIVVNSAGSVVIACKG